MVKWGIDIIWNMYCIDPGNDDTEIMELILWYRRWALGSFPMLFELAVSEKLRVEGATIFQCHNAKNREYFQAANPAAPVTLMVWEALITKYCKHEADYRRNIQSETE